MSDRVAVYIVSMGRTPEAIGEFARRFSARFGVPEQKVLTLGRRLPVRVGSYDIDKAKLIGIEIKKMGGQASLRREAIQEDEPATVTAPSAEGDGGSWIVRGQAESQDELVSMTQPSSDADAAPSAAYDYPSLSDGDSPAAVAPPPERKIAGKYEAKQAYTAEQTRGLDDEHFRKVKALYADKKRRRNVTGSPAFRIGLFALFLSLAVYLYMERRTILSGLAGFENVTLTDAYEHRLPPAVTLPADLTGSYSGDMKYATKTGDIAFVEVTLSIEGKNVQAVAVDISSSAADIGSYRLKIEYTPGNIKYIRIANSKTIYAVENTFPTTGGTIAPIDEDGRFSLTLNALDAGIDPSAVPQSEKDRLGNAVLIKMEGGYANDGRFYGGLVTSGTPLMGWEAKKK